MKKRTLMANFQDISFDNWERENDEIPVMLTILICVISIAIIIVLILIVISIATSVWMAFFYAPRIMIPVSLALSAVIWLIRVCNTYYQQAKKMLEVEIQQNQENL